MNFNRRVIDFVKHSKKFFWLSSIFTIVGIIVLFVFGLNLGIDFSSGSKVEIMAEEPLSSEQIIEDFKQIGSGYEPNDVTLAGANNEIAYATFVGELDKNEVAEIRSYFHEKYHHEPNIGIVSELVGKELARNAMIAVALASIGIVIYVAIRFELPYGVAAIISLLHDAFFIIVIFSMLRIEIRVEFIAAVLTIVGYSINDTIVTFDRIRENLKLEKKAKTFKDLAHIVNLSLTQVLSRSINTVLTVILAAAAIFIFGGESIRSFAFALLIGLVAGTYSSMFLAAQLWLVWEGRKLSKKQVSSNAQVE